MLSNLRRNPKFHVKFSVFAYFSVKRLLSTLPTGLTPTGPSTKAHLKALVLKRYRNGKFSNLIRNIVASPSVLLFASQNLMVRNKHEPNSTEFSDSLSRSVAIHFSIEEMGLEVFDNKFDIERNCVELTDNGDSLVLPNLKLKVLIEAIRAVLEIVYDDHFVSFSYGGRVGMGRHTAVRYLKNSVSNPSWWFTVSFEHIKFDTSNVSKLCLFIEERIEDRMLIDLIYRLFKCRVLTIELGGLYLGRGFPQECGLCSILINIYFDGFDRTIQAMRLKISELNPKFDPNEIGKRCNSFYNPVKIYAVRYMDEILVITSGSRMLAMDLKNKVLSLLEGKLEVKVNRASTCIHNSEEEKIEFLGMELQAVPPSILRPPMSEKAIRARKKYLRQKEVKALEMRNAKERNRRKLGLKLLKHVLKKSKQSNCKFKFEPQIENTVQEIFTTWADEVVFQFFGSMEERANWHQMLKSGNFLSLRQIRTQLPEYLINAYDNFQEQVEKYLSPLKARKALKEEERRIEEDEMKKYEKRTTDDLTKLCMKVSAPINLLRKAVKATGFTNQMGRPQPLPFLAVLEDADIVKWYAGVGRRWLDFFCCCHNLKMVKIVVSYHLRFSCILTLAEKHEATKREAMKHFTKDLKVTGANGSEEVHFPREKEVKMMGDKNLSDPKPVDGALSLLLIRLASNEPLRSCAAHFCDQTDTITYRVRLVRHVVNENERWVEVENWVHGMGEIHKCVDRKCISLCSSHIGELYTGRITLQDIDYASFMCLD